MEATTTWKCSRNPDWMIRQVVEQGAYDRELRLFACWCARQTNLEKDEWREAVNVAERFARTDVELSVMRRLRNGMRGMNTAADAMEEVMVEKNDGAASTAAALAAYQTLRSDPAQAAKEAARMAALWARLKADCEGEGEEGIPKNDSAEQQARQEQADKLRALIDLSA